MFHRKAVPHAIAAVQLQCGIDHALSGLGGVQLGHCGLAADPRRALVFDPCRAIDQQGRGVDIQRHIGNMALHHLQLCQRRAADLAALNARQGLVQRAAGKPKRRGPHGGTEHVQHRHRDLEPVAGFADQRRFRQGDVVEPQMRQRVGGDDLDPLHNLQPRQIGGHQKGRKTPRTGGLAGAGKDHINIGDPAIGDIGLFAVQQIPALHGCGGGGCSGNIRPRPRFCQCKGGQGRAGSGFSQPLALRIRAKQRHGTHPQPLHRKGEVSQSVVPGKGFPDQAQAAHIQLFTGPRAGMLQPAAVAQQAHKADGCGIDIRVIHRQMRLTPGL